MTATTRSRPDRAFDRQAREVGLAAQESFILDAIASVKRTGRNVPRGMTSRLRSVQRALKRLAR